MFALYAHDSMKFHTERGAKSCEFLTLTFDGLWVTNVQFCYFGTVCKKIDNLVS